MYHWRTHSVVPMLGDVLMALLLSLFEFDSFKISYPIDRPLEWYWSFIEMWNIWRIDTFWCPWYTHSNINDDLLLAQCIMHPFLLSPVICESLGVCVQLFGNQMETIVMHWNCAFHEGFHVLIWNRHCMQYRAWWESPHLELAMVPIDTQEK